MATVIVGLRGIDEERTQRRAFHGLRVDWRGWLAKLRELPGRLHQLWIRSRLMRYMVLFILFWKLSPSVGYIERSYLVDERAFTPSSFGIILSVGGVTFLLSLLAYRVVVRHLPSIKWHHYLYAMVAIGVLSFPLSFFLYLDPTHPWWRPFESWTHWRPAFNPLPAWNRYEWFRLVTETILGFATIPAFIIPLTMAALRDYLRAHRGGMGALVETARADRIYTFMRPYLEALA